MGHLFRAAFSLYYFPNEWLTSKTVVIRRLEHLNYGLPKAYYRTSQHNVKNTICIYR